MQLRVCSSATTGTRLSGERPSDQEVRSDEGVRAIHKTSATSAGGKSSAIMTYGTGDFPRRTYNTPFGTSASPGIIARGIELVFSPDKLHPNAVVHGTTCRRCGVFNLNGAKRLVEARRGC